MAAETTNTQAAGAEKTLLSVKDLNVSYGAIHADCYPYWRKRRR